MAPSSSRRPAVFVDADVLFAGAASPSEHGASLVVLRLAEITLIEAFTSEQAVAEVERNLLTKMPSALPAFHFLISRCLTVLPDPTPEERQGYRGLADPKDLALLVAAIQGGCQWLVTFNVRHYRPGHPTVSVLQPGAFVQRLRQLLTHLS